METKVLYLTPGVISNKMEKGTQSEREFSSLEEAIKAPLPDKHDFAYIKVEGGYYCYNKIFGWEGPFKEEVDYRAAAQSKQ